MTSTSPRYDDLSALFINCTLKPSPELSHTQGLVAASAGIMAAQGARTEIVRAVDHDIATGVWPDMTEHGAATDAWPRLYPKVLAADILVIAGPIWLGDNSSVTKKVIERLYGCSHLLNEAGQYAYYGRVGGCLITGNEDGIKHCAMNVLYSLQHLGYTIPPQADAGWIGRAEAVLPRSRLRRPGERLHQPQHHVHDLEPAAPGPDAQGRGRNPGPRQPALGMGRRLPVRLPQPRIPVTSCRRRLCASPRGRAGVAATRSFRRLIPDLASI
jgi:multimeric flavodoxin WrbA